MCDDTSNLNESTFNRSMFGRICLRLVTATCCTTPTWMPWPASVFSNANNQVHSQNLSARSTACQTDSKDWNLTKILTQTNLSWATVPDRKTKCLASPKCACAPGVELSRNRCWTLSSHNLGCRHQQNKLFSSGTTTFHGASGLRVTTADLAPLSALKARDFDDFNLEALVQQFGNGKVACFWGRRFEDIEKKPSHKRFPFQTF